MYHILLQETVDHLLSTCIAPLFLVLELFLTVAILHNYKELCIISCSLSRHMLIYFMTVHVPFGTVIVHVQKVLYLHLAWLRGIPHCAQ